MIRLRRGDAPAILVAPLGKGETETHRAIAAYRDGRRPRRKFEFEAYRDNAVKHALNEMSNYKCAYCESSYEALAPVDVEHYRPKGPFRDEGGETHPGYYWLAARWDNLLPSCIDCNRRRRHEAGAFGYGKASEFPVRGKRAMRPGEENSERRLLLHPCRDRPRAHLVFLADGGVLPAERGGRRSVKGQTSIRVYGLTRPGLVRVRAVYAARVLGDLEMAQRAVENMARHREDVKASELVRLHLQRLAAHGSARSAYAELARQLITPILQRIGIGPLWKETGS